MQINISRQQADFIRAKTRGKMYLGSVGAGKTFVMCLSAIHEAIAGRHTLIASFSYRNLKDVVLPTITQIADTHGIPYITNISDMCVTIRGTPILLRTATDPERLRSFNLHSFFIEEAREVNRAVYDVLLGRLRLSEDCFWGIVSTTRGKNWFYDIIAEEGLTDIFDKDLRYAASDNITVIRSTIDDSPFLPKAYIADLKRQYSASFAAQELECMIVDGTGAIINPNWFKVEEFNKPIKGIRFWDLAVTTKKTSDFSAGCLLAKTDTRYYIHDIVKAKLEYPDLKKLILETALADGPGIIIGFEDAGQQMAIISDIRACPELSNYVIKSMRPTKDKITRAYPWCSQAELGNITINRAPWNRQFFDECNSFSTESVLKGTAHDDMIDSVTGAYTLRNDESVLTFTNMRI